MKTSLLLPALELASGFSRRVTTGRFVPALGTCFWVFASSGFEAEQSRPLSRSHFQDAPESTEPTIKGCTWLWGNNRGFCSSSCDTHLYAEPPSTHSRADQFFRIELQGKAGERERNSLSTAPDKGQTQARNRKETYHVQKKNPWESAGKKTERIFDSLTAQSKT